MSLLDKFKKELCTCLTVCTGKNLVYVRAKKVTVILTVVALTYETIAALFWHHLDNALSDACYIISVTVRVIVPVAVLVINVVVVVQVRRAASNAAANLGVQPHHHQSTSNNSAVPTVMLVATSLVYAVVYGTVNIVCLIQWCVWKGDFSFETKVVAMKYRNIASAVGVFVFAYNVCIYLVTGRQFRSELRKLLRRCLPPSSSSAHAASDAAHDNA